MPTVPFTLKSSPESVIPTFLLNPVLRVRRFRASVLIFPRKVELPGSSMTGPPLVNV